MARSLSSIPLVVLGLTLVLLGLIKGSWSPDYVNPQPRHTVSHQARMLGQDKPPGVEAVERRPGYMAFRLLDALIYLALAQIGVASLALIFARDRFFLWLLMVASLYGAVYSATLGLVIGSQLTFIGFSLIFLASILEWFSTRSVKRVNNESHSAA